MTKTARNNWITTLIVVLWIFAGLTLGLSGCASTKLKYGDIEWESHTLWKDVGQVNAQAQDLQFRLGASISAEDLDALIAAGCILKPDLPACQLNP